MNSFWFDVQKPKPSDQYFNTGPVVAVLVAFLVAAYIGAVVWQFFAFNIWRT